MPNERDRDFDRQMAESQTAELQNVRVLLEEARAQIENISAHRRRDLLVHISGALRAVDAQLRDLAREL
jgi:hypothetical protein